MVSSLTVDSLLLMVRLGPLSWSGGQSRTMGLAFWAHMFDKSSWHDFSTPPRGKLCQEESLSHLPNIKLIRSRGKICHRQWAINAQLSVSPSFHSFTDTYLSPFLSPSPCHFLLLFLFPFLKYLLSFCYVPDSVLVTRHTRVNQTQTLVSRSSQTSEYIIISVGGCISCFFFCCVTNYSKM